MTIGEKHLEIYTKRSNELINGIDLVFDSYTDYITKQLLNYIPGCIFDTRQYLYSIDIEDLIKSNDTVKYEWVINNYNARLHLGTKLDNWLKEFSANEHISYTMGSGRITFNLIKEKETL